MKKGLAITSGRRGMDMQRMRTFQLEDDDKDTQTFAHPPDSSHNSNNEYNDFSEDIIDSKL
eukprot:12784595-Ditylum_brightwellii.AAC.1